MDSSDWVGWSYGAVAVLLFPFLVRLMWKEELNRVYEPSLGIVGLFALCLSVVWPLILVFWVMMGLLTLITVGIKENK